MDFISVKAGSCLTVNPAEFLLACAPEFRYVLLPRDGAALGGLDVAGLAGTGKLCGSSGGSVTKAGISAKSDGVTVADKSSGLSTSGDSTTTSVTESLEL
jgi:hypothetical protein